MHSFLKSVKLVCDCDGLWRPPESNTTSKLVGEVLKEHCDGNRNILHMCVNACIPTSNKDYEQGQSTSLSPSPLSDSKVCQPPSLYSTVH